jgi:hypothetical protein
LRACKRFEGGKTLSGKSPGKSPVHRGDFKKRRFNKQALNLCGRVFVRRARCFTPAAPEYHERW